MSKQRIVITGVGWVTPLGHDIEEVWANLLAGKSGIRPTRRFDAATFPPRNFQLRLKGMTTDSG